MIYSSVFAFCLSILVFYQTYYISSGKTTNESLRKKDYAIWDEGCLENWKKTFNLYDEDGKLYINNFGSAKIVKEEKNDKKLEILGEKIKEIESGNIKESTQNGKILTDNDQTNNNDNENNIENGIQYLNTEEIIKNQEKYLDK